MGNIKTVYKIKWKNLLIILAIIVVLVIGGFIAIKYLIDYNKTSKVITKISEEVKVNNIVDDEKTKTITPDSKLSKFDIYWDYIKLGLIDVDMASLKRINSDSIGYLEIKGTNFSYPIVKGEDDFYKSHSFDKSKNILGWLYVDKDNNIESLDTNTIIYGNKVFGNKLAGSLNEMQKSSWNEDKNNFIIRFSTNYHSTLWQIISVYDTKDKSYIKKDFTNEDEVQSYAESVIQKSKIKFKAGTLPTDKFLTITTNSNGTNMVVHAKLIKIREETN